jgi:aromatic-L-amino-acid decarboxylase
MTEEETLDPRNWDQLRVLGHRMLDDMLTHLSTLRQQPTWQAMPDSVIEKKMHRDAFVHSASYW